MATPAPDLTPDPNPDPHEPASVPENPENPENPEASSESSRAKNSGTNKAHAAALEKAQTIAETALEPAYLAKLIEDEEPPDPADDSRITEQGINDLLAKVANCREDLGAAGSSDAEGEDATEEIDQAEHGLVAAIQVVQSRARQKYKRKSPAILAAYHIGDRLMGNRSKLNQFATDILTRLKTDSFQGAGMVQKQAIIDAQAVWVVAIKRQTDAGSTGKGGRGSVRQQLDAIMDYRLKIQYAADAIWPYHNPANAGIRGEFYLTAHRPFDG